MAHHECRSFGRAQLFQRLFHLFPQLGVAREAVRSRPFVGHQDPTDPALALLPRRSAFGVARPRSSSASFGQSRNSPRCDTPRYRNSRAIRIGQGSCTRAKELLEPLPRRLARFPSCGTPDEIAADCDARLARGKHRARPRACARRRWHRFLGPRSGVPRGLGCYRRFRSSESLDRKKGLRLGRQRAQCALVWRNWHPGLALGVKSPTASNYRIITMGLPASVMHTVAVETRRLKRTATREPT